MLIRNYADIQKLGAEGGLSDAEKMLVENSKNGTLTVLGDGSRPSGSNGARSIRAGLLRYLMLGGCTDFQVHEHGVRLAGAWVTGPLDLRYLETKGAVNLTNCAFDSPIDAQYANFEFLQLKNSFLVGINLECASVRGSVVLTGVQSNGTVFLAAATIGSQLSCAGAILDGGLEMAFSAQGATVGDSIIFDHLRAYGEVSLVGVKAGGQLSCNHAALDGRRAKALNAQNATIEAGVFLKGTTASGEICISNGAIGSNFECTDAVLSGTHGPAFVIENTSIVGSMIMVKAQCYGRMSISGARIRGSCSFANATLSAAGGIALNAQDLVVEKGLYWRKLSSIEGQVDFSSAHFRQLVDDEHSWNLARDVILIGVTYDHVFGPLDLTFRKRWVSKGSTFKEQFHPQPYQQLAKFYRETGHRYEAREILVAKEIDQRKATREAIRERKARTEGRLHPNVLVFLNLVWDWTTRLVAGYGYKPWLSLGWLGGLVGLMTVGAQATWNAGDFAPNSAIVLTSADWKVIADGSSEKPAVDWSNGPGKDYETFYSFAYALDVVVPVLELGQMEAWAPSPARGPWGYWLFYGQKMFVALGWVVTALAAAAVTGMIRRDD